MQISSLWSIKPEFRLKVALLSITFMFLTAAQAVWRSLKASIFAKIVGVAYIPDAKIYGIFLLIPLILLYSKLVDVLRRHHLVYVFTLFHAVGGLILAYYLAHPTIGIANTAASPNRALGWFFYFFMESFCAFLSTTFWSFANSVNKPKDAKNYYGLFVVGSKTGGILAAGTLWLFLSVGLNKFATGVLAGHRFNDGHMIGGAMAFGSLMLFGAAIAIFLLMKLVPGYYMHGYEAVYQVEKQREKEQPNEKFSLTKSFRQAIDGLRVILINPYVLGIFSLSLFHDIIMTIFDYMVLSSANANHDTAAKLTLFYAGYFFSMHFIGLFISFFGTTPLQRLLGNRASLLIYPSLCMTLVAVSFFFPTAQVFLTIVVILRAANYGLNHPIREVLYIPTTKEIKFKCKAWSDAFGSRLAKGSASVFYKHVVHFSPAVSQLMSSAFTFSITIVWVIISYFLGRKLQTAIDKKQVIGETETGSASKVAASE